jgi:hypothetical protein
MMNVMRDAISGRTANDESPTNPLVRLDTAFSFLISRPSNVATTSTQFFGGYNELRHDRQMSKVPRSSAPNMHDTNRVGTEIVVSLGCPFVQAQ